MCNVPPMDGPLSICSLEFTIHVLFFPYLILPCYIHFSCCTLFTLRSFNVALFRVSLFCVSFCSNCIISMLYFSRSALFSCYTLFMLHSEKVLSLFFCIVFSALCSCCTFSCHTFPFSIFLRK